MSLESDLFKKFNTNVLLLTGAGASKPLGMPLMREFYDLVNMQASQEQRELLHDVFMIHNKETRDAEFDLEALLALVEKYRNFYDIFFGENKFGYPVDNIKDEIEQLEFKNRNRAEGWEPPSYLMESYSRKEKLESLDILLRNLMFQEYGKSLEDSKLDALYSPLFELIDKHTSQGFIPIFTTNYDMAIETYAQESNIHLEAGFESIPTGNVWKPARFYQFQLAEGKQNVLLFKLHGSLTYHRKGNSIVSTGLPIRDPSGYKSVVIYPTQTKEFPDEQPFRTMYDFLKGCLGVAKLAIVIGYSFRDRGIQRIMDDALDNNPNLRFILICGPNVDRWKKFAQQNLKSYEIIPHYFDCAPSGGEYLEELDAALAELKP